MRITNNMMLNNTSKNINGNKLNVNALNLQMTSQKKIQRPSEDPVIAIRALRLRSTLSQINQCYERNIPDAETWMEVSETALKNMNKILTDVRTQCVNGTNSYLTAEDRNTILSSLSALQKQLYSEGNADNGGRTVFTGYKTNSPLTFMEAEADTSYEISQNFTYEDIEEHEYLSGSVDVPNTLDEVLETDNICKIDKTSCDRIRLAYDSIEEIEGISYTYGDPTTTVEPAVTIYEDEDAWSAACVDGIKTVGENEMIFIKSSGDLVLGTAISNELKSNKASIDIEYQKTGFDEGELRPEYYYNCVDVTDKVNPIEYTRYDENGKKVYEDINFTVALNQNLKVNMEANEIFDMSIYQDVVEMTDAVQAAIDAHDKVDKLTEMRDQAQYVDYQEQIQEWLDAAQKEADYADQNLTNLYGAAVGKFDAYMEELNIAYTELGSRGEQLAMTESRVSNQQLTVEELKSTNEDKELSDIIIDYTAAYNAYQAALLAAGKMEEQTLLNYI